MPRASHSRALIGVALALLGGGAASADPGEHRTVIRPDAPFEQSARPTQVIDRSQLGDAGADLPSALDAAPGLRVTRLGGPGALSILSVRGSTADQVLVFVDGIPLATAEGGPVDLSSLPLGPIGHVAVYRGLSPVVLGSSAIGGAVDVRTRSLSGRRLEVELGGGSFATRAGRAFYGDGGADWGAAVALDYQGSAGDFAYTHDGATAWDGADDVATRRANNDHDQLTAMAKGQVRLGRRAQLTLLDLVSHRAGGLAGLGLHPTRESRLTTTRNVLGARLAVALGEPDADDGRGVVRLVFTPWLTWSRTALSDPLGEIGLGAAETRDTSLIPGLSVAAHVPWTRGDADVGLASLFAATYRHEGFTRGATEARGAATAGRHVVTAAAEGHLALRRADTDVTVAARYEGARGHGGDAFPTAEQDAARPAAGPAIDGASARLAVVNTSVTDLRLSVAASRSLRLPSLYELYGDTGYVLGNPGLRPERGHGLELGVAWSPSAIAGGHLTVDAAGFVTFVDDLIQLVQNAQGVARPDNVDSARLAGVEVGVSADAFRLVRARAALTWLDAVNTSDIPARRGKRLPFRPRWTAHTRLELYRDLGGAALSELGARVELDHVSGNHLDHANLVSVPARLLVGVGAYATMWDRQLRVDVAVRNLTDDRVQDLSGFPLPGLSAMVTVAWTPDLREPVVVAAAPDDPAPAEIVEAPEGAGP